MTALRFGMLLVVATFIPSCGRDKEWFHVTVHNDGQVSAEVYAETEYWTPYSGEDRRETVVWPQETVEFRFRLDGLYRLKVTILRSTDHLTLLYDSWSHDDLEHGNEHVWITVTP